jgi:predicted nucleic-acid-binding protein
VKNQVKLPDTNVILRYLLADAPELYEKAQRLFEKIRVGDEKAVILESVLVECVYVLTKFYKVPKAEAATRLKELLLYKGVANNDKDDLIEALSIFADKGPLDIVDCVLSAKSKSSGMTMVMFDEKLKKRHGG